MPATEMENTEQADLQKTWGHQDGYNLTVDEPQIAPAGGKRNYPGP